jgi:proline iminopeptidase
MSLGDAASPTGAPPDDELLARVRVQVHYLANDCFLRENELLDNLWRVPRVPTIIVQGRQDMVCPPSAALAVARGLPGAELQMVPGAGHSASQPAMAARLCEAVARIQARLSPP